MIAVPNPAEIIEYLQKHPGLLVALLVYCGEAQKEFTLTDAELSLELYRDPEIADEYIILYVRCDHYGFEIMERMERVSEICEPLLVGVDGRMVITTDFRFP